jgi:hypothetical protein
MAEGVQARAAHRRACERQASARGARERAVHTPRARARVLGARRWARAHARRGGARGARAAPTETVAAS